MQELHSKKLNISALMTLKVVTEAHLISKARKRNGSVTCAALSIGQWCNGAFRHSLQTLTFGEMLHDRVVFATRPPVTGRFIK